MAILKKNGELQQQKFDFLLRGPKVMGMENPLKEWVLDSVWGSVQALKASASHKPFGTMFCFERYLRQTFVRCVSLSATWFAAIACFTLHLCCSGTLCRACHLSQVRHAAATTNASDCKSFLTASPATTGAGGLCCSA